MVQNKTYYVYLLASRRNGTLYAGVTNDIARRMREHKGDLNDGFTKKYKVHMLVYFESMNDIRDAIRREKQIEKWLREWKIELIESQDPEWRDLYYDLFPGGDEGSFA